jgi:hypothetical protein
MVARRINWQAGVLSSRVVKVFLIEEIYIPFPNVGKGDFHFT